MIELNQKSFIYKILWISLIIFAIGASMSISLEELGAFFSMLAFGILIIMKQTKLKKTIIDIPILLIVIGFILASLIISPHKLNSLKENLSDLWMIPLLYVVVSTLTIEQYKKILHILLWVSFFVALYGIWQSYTGIDFIKHRTLTQTGNFFYASGLWGLHLTYGGFMGMVSLVFLGLFFTIERWWEGNKIFYLLGSVASFMATFLSFSRSAVLGLVFGFAFFVLVNIKKTYKALLIFIFLSLIIFSFSPEVKKHMKTMTSMHYLKSIPRYEFFLTSLNMIKHNWIFGIAAGNYDRLYNQYKLKNFRFGGHDHPHNDILNMYLLGGILGFLGYILLFGIIIIKGTKKYFKIKNDFFLLGLLASVVVMFFQGFSQCYFIDSENAWLFWFLTAGIILFFNDIKNLEN